MIVATQGFQGYLDISSPANGFNRSLRPGETVSIPDKAAGYASVKNAIDLGYLTIVSYDSNAESDVTQAELAAVQQSVQVAADQNYLKPSALGINASGYTWDDLKVPLTSLKLIGVNAPTFSFFKNNGGDVLGEGGSIRFKPKRL